MLLRQIPPDPALNAEYRAINESFGAITAKFQHVPEFGLSGMKDEVRLEIECVKGWGA